MLKAEQGELLRIVSRVFTALPLSFSLPYHPRMREIRRIRWMMVNGILNPCSRYVTCGVMLLLVVLAGTCQALLVPAGPCRWRGVTIVYVCIRVGLGTVEGYRRINSFFFFFFIVFFTFFLGFTRGR
ncbi:uncharacterized protein F4812DRAFT_416020 [Daldinia caldariorum]|uniref:uncharacterized protein n=1 Tax=Daldinia caldariorum TaxID=326644 RepID=UPI002007A9BB|nr:uncharacterized protein F4812DRAFT_416020 [Daldinia caldariorum]KAI1471920.1 hypothetical protein F4812DRAFT_416020 [Daldinia caldariorum]